MLIHWPGPSRGWPNKSNPDGTPGMFPADWTPAMRMKTWEALEDLLMAGRVMVIGVCNYSLRQMKELVEKCRIKPMVLQTELHPQFQQKDLVQYCEEQGILVQAYASLGGGEPMKKRNFTLTTNPTVTSIAARRSKTAAQVLLRWAFQK